MNASRLREYGQRGSKMIGDALNVISDYTGIRAVIDPLSHPKRPGCKTLKIPGYKQVQEHTCGFIAAANVIHLFNPSADLGILYDSLDDRDGTTDTEVVSALRRNGINVRKRTTLDFPAICEAIGRGAPIISGIKMIFHDHWVVIYGYDIHRQSLFICGNGHLPFLNRKEVPYEKFCKKWEPIGNGLVCTPGDLKQPKPRKKRRRVAALK